MICLSVCEGYAAKNSKFHIRFNQMKNTVVGRTATLECSR